MIVMVKFIYVVVCDLYMFKAFWNKRGSMPYWMTMTIYILIGLLIVLGLIMLVKDQILELLRAFVGRF